MEMEGNSMKKRKNRKPTTNKKILCLIYVLEGILLCFIIFLVAYAFRDKSVETKRDVVPEIVMQTETIQESAEEYTTEKVTTEEITSVESNQEQLPVKLQDMNVSIVGDSISSFSENVSFGYPSCYPHGDIDSVNQMWWSIVEQNTGVHMSVKAAYSGGTCSGNSLDSELGASSCSNKRIQDLKVDGQKGPNIIFVFNGINDYINSTEIGTFDGKSNLDEGEEITFSEGYGLMLQKLKAEYPNAVIFCCTILETAGGYDSPDEGQCLNKLGNSVANYNECIRKLSGAYGCKLIDVSTHSGINRDNQEQYTVDSIHPNQAGMKKIAEVISNELLKYEVELGKQ